MPRPCQICKHPMRHQIDLDLVRDQDVLRILAERYDVNKNALQRHKKHVKILLDRARAANEVQATDEAIDLVAECRSLMQKTKEILARADVTQDLRLALQAIRRIEHQIELQGKLLGQISDAPQVNIWAQFNDAAGSVMGQFERMMSGDNEALRGQVMAMMLPESPVAEAIDVEGARANMGKGQAHLRDVALDAESVTLPPRKQARPSIPAPNSQDGQD